MTTRETKVVHTDYAEVIDVKFPAGFALGGFQYRIIPWLEGCEEEPKEEDLDNVLGKFNADKLLIHVRPFHSKRRVGEVLLHEILHALYFAWNIQDKDDEERTVMSLGFAMTHLWNENPELFDFLHGLMTED